jgi:hypothetical protein
VPPMSIVRVARGRSGGEAGATFEEVRRRVAADGRAPADGRAAVRPGAGTSGEADADVAGAGEEPGVPRRDELTMPQTLRRRGRAGARGTAFCPAFRVQAGLNGVEG